MSGFYDVLRAMVSAHDSGDEAREARLLLHPQEDGSTLADRVAGDIQARAVDLSMDPRNDGISPQPAPRPGGLHAAPKGDGRPDPSHDNGSVPATAEPEVEPRVRFRCGTCGSNGVGRATGVRVECPDCGADRKVWPCGDPEPATAECPSCVGVLPCSVSGPCGGSRRVSVANVLACYVCEEDIRPGADTVVDLESKREAHVKCTLPRSEDVAANRIRMAVEQASECKPFPARHKGASPSCEVCLQPVEVGDRARRCGPKSSRRVHESCMGTA